MTGVDLLWLLRQFEGAELVSTVDVVELLLSGPVTGTLENGRVRLTGPAGTYRTLLPSLTAHRDRLPAALAEHRDLIEPTLIGRRSGHVPAPCDECRAVVMTAAKTSAGKPRKTWPKCRLTPGCEGRHVPRPDDLERASHGRPPPAQARQPAHVDKKRLLGDPTPWPTNDEPEREGDTDAD